MSWKYLKLNEVCTLINGRAYKKDELLSEGKYKVLRVGNFFTNNHWYYSDLELDGDKYCHNGDLLYAWSASFGPRFWNEDDTIYHYHIWKVECNENINKFFLFKLFEWDKDKIIKEYGTGTTMVHVSKSSMEKRILPIPPLSEQQAIVEKLDAAFALIDHAKANLEKNIQNAKELFQSKLNELFSGNTVSLSYSKKKFKEICVLQRGFDLPTRLREKGNFPLVSSNGVTDFISDFKVKGKGVVTGRSGTIGKVHFIEKDFWPLNTTLYIKDFKGNFEKYIFYFLKSIKWQKYASGAGVPTLNRNFIHDEFFVTVDIFLHQQKIVNELDQLSTQTETLQQKYTQKLQNLEELRKSILEKAFKGELVQMS